MRKSKQSSPISSSPPDYLPRSVGVAIVNDGIRYKREECSTGNNMSRPGSLSSLCSSNLSSTPPSCFSKSNKYSDGYSSNSSSLSVSPSTPKKEWEMQLKSHLMQNRHTLLDDSSTDSNHLKVDSPTSRSMPSSSLPSAYSLLDGVPSLVPQLVPPRDQTRLGEYSSKMKSVQNVKSHDVEDSCLSGESDNSGHRPNGITRIFKNAPPTGDKPPSTLDQGIDRGSDRSTRGGNIFSFLSKNKKERKSKSKKQIKKNSFLKKDKSSNTSRRTKSCDSLLDVSLRAGDQSSRTNSKRHNSDDWKGHIPKSNKYGPIGSVITPNGTLMNTIKRMDKKKETKLVFTDLRNSITSKDTSTAYLGEEKSIHRGKNFDQFRGSSKESPDGLTPVKEETDLTDSSITILNPIEGVESWKEESRNLFFPAIAAMCRQEVFEKFKSNYSSKDVKASRFGSISLGSVLMSKEPTDNMKNEDYIWLVGDFELRQNYLLEYGKTKGSSLPRGYVFLQGAKIRRHPRIENALQLEFHHRHSTRIKCRVVIRLKSSIEEKRWMTCLQEASHLKIEDLYEFDISEGAKVLGTGRYATIRPARRRKLINNNNSPLHSSLRHPSVGENSYGNENGILKKKPSFSSFPNLHLLAQQEYNECALKIIDKNLYWQHVKRGTERVDTIVRETCVQADLIAHSKDHKGFVGLRSFFETQDKVVLELELLEGTDLYEYIRKKRPLAEKEAAHIMYDILGCMDVMKKLGIAHRDLKPANILMANKPNPYGMHVKVGDFGNATFVGEDNLVRGRCGTVGYVAPEILLAQKNSGYKNKVDEFSAGVILYVLLCGYEPFFGEDERELTAVNTKAKVEFPEEDWLSISIEGRDLVEQLLTRDPSKRIEASKALQHPWITRRTKNKQTQHSGNGNTFGVDEFACVIS